MRRFNTTGPCVPLRHYMLPPLERTPEVLPLVRDQVYVAVSGPRQSGKTSLLKAIVTSINADGWARAVYVTCEPAGSRSAGHSPGDVEGILLEQWYRSLRLSFRDVDWPAAAEILKMTPGGRIGEALARWSVASDLPLVMVIDEIDTLDHFHFHSLLSQIRAGSNESGTLFPHSIVLAGMRSLRDHDIATGGDGNGSPFNIVKYLQVGHFSRDELVQLYAQHTAETGQVFSEGAIALAWQQTQGQPWLVNAIASECVTALVTDRTHSIEATHVAEAVRRMEQSRPMHLASLARRLSEERVLRVVAPIVVGDAPAVGEEDTLYATELGILTRDASRRLQPANPIYARALLHALTAPKVDTIASWAPSWLVNGHIDLNRLRENFLSFWALNRNMMKDRITYPEAVAHFGLMAYLDRVANGGGRVDREFAVGRGRLDLLLVHGNLRLPIEVKVQRDREADPVPEGLAQLDRYCEGLRVGDAWLVVFDQRSDASGTRLEAEDVVTAGGRRVVIIRA